MRRILCLLVVFLSLCSCREVYWSNPIFDSQKAQVDQRLIGTWRGELYSEGKAVKQAGEVSWHIRQGGKNVMKVLVENSTNQFNLYASKLGARTFLNVESPSGTDDLPKGFFLVWEYEITPEGYLILRLMINCDLLEKAILNRTLQGELIWEDRESEYAPVTVRADSGEIRAFLFNTPTDKLFMDAFYRFRKMKGRAGGTPTKR
ncbi:MAG: hypothetical protein MUO52_15685 [Desulfobacterales bacterium]|nr:hypothetical protein [Desulfobacterales bacterium]